MMLRTELRPALRLAWKTRTGHRHRIEGRENEDAVFVAQDHPRFDAVLVVADGMGGHSRPREAAETAVRTVRESLFDPATLARHASPPGEPAALLEAAVAAAHRAVQDLRSASSASGHAVRRSVGGASAARPPGTTLSVAVVEGETLHVAHVGDGSVFLMRDGRATLLAGGEAARDGYRSGDPPRGAGGAGPEMAGATRPAQFLGQEGPLRIEARRVSLVPGDRVLLCTDGLTRYFREAGSEALERVMSRRGVELEAVAAQLTAHSRADDYDDDTTVALLELTGFERAARRPEGRMAQRSVERAAEPQRLGVPGRGGESGPFGRSAPPGGPGGWIAGALVGAVLLAAGFAAGRWTAGPRAVEPGGATWPAGGAAAPGLAEPAPPEVLRHLPRGNLVLVDPLGRRLYLLATGRETPGGRPADGPVDLRAFRLGADGRFEPAGRFRLDPARALLEDTEGRRYPVEADLARGAIRILRGGRLRVESDPPGARVRIDGRLFGVTPLQVPLAAGVHRVRVEGPNGSQEAAVEVPAGGAAALRLRP